MDKGKHLPHTETRYDDLVGVVAINLDEHKNFNSIAASIGAYDPSRFEAVALRVFIQHTPVVTLYAKEKEAIQDVNAKNKLQVHKFKKEMSFEELFSKFRKLNFTVTAGEYDIDNMEVVNDDKVLE